MVKGQLRLESYFLLDQGVVSGSGYSPPVFGSQPGGLIKHKSLSFQLLHNSALWTIFLQMERFACGHQVFFFSATKYLPRVPTINRLHCTIDYMRTFFLVSSKDSIPERKYFAIIFVDVKGRSTCVMHSMQRWSDKYVLDISHSTK